MKDEIRSLFGVEYAYVKENDIECSTYEIFRTVEEAEKFALNSGIIPLYIFSADFYNVYVDDDGSLNYDDYSDTMNNQKIIKRFEI